MTKTIFLITIFILTLNCFQASYSQSALLDFNSFDYHEVFCKDQTATKKIKTDKKLQRFNIVKYYATQLVNEGKVSFNDTLSKYLNRSCQKLKVNNPIFDFQIALVKKSTSGFLSVSNNMIYLYIGTIARLSSDDELINLLYIIAKNHANSENYQSRFIKISKTNEHTYDDVVLSNQINIQNFDQANEAYKENFNKSTALNLNIFTSIDFQQYDSSVFHFPFLPYLFNHSLEAHNKGQNQYLCSIARYTQCMLLYEEGNYDKSLIYSQLYITSTPNKYLILLIQKNLYMISYSQIINNKDNEFINIFHPKNKITAYDEYEYNCQAAQYFSYLHFNLLNNDYLLSEMKTLSKKVHERYANYYDKPDCFNDSTGWQKLNNGSTYKRLKLDTILDLSKSQAYDKTETIRQSILFKEEINASNLLDHKNKILKNTILIFSPTVEYINDNKSTFSYEKYYIHEKRKNNFYIKNIESSLNSFLERSPFKKAYTSNQSIIVHLDKYNNKKHEESSILELKPNIDQDMVTDSMMQSKDIKYIVYIKVHVYDNNLNPNLSKLAYNIGLSQLTEKKELLLIADVYDLEHKKYIIACRRIIGSRSKDLMMANWFDIFKSILP